MLTVFIENSYYNPMRRIELFGTIDFIANCGGLLGLCLGFSVLSIVEVLYWLLVRPLCQRRCSKRTQARDADAPAHKDFAVFALAPPRQR
ncbi:Pickpocket protein 28 [Gryllus bimaculatus]|nr:Pickpocket protein 28 [Gryllus bimaculatus]